jgi:hypothetical protein
VKPQPWIIRKSASSNGELPESVNLLSRLNPRQRGSLSGEAAGRLESGSWATAMLKNPRTIIVKRMEGIARDTDLSLRVVGKLANTPAIRCEKEAKNAPQLHLQSGQRIVSYIRSENSEFAQDFQ